MSQNTSAKTAESEHQEDADYESAPVDDSGKSLRLTLGVPAMLFASSAIMSLAWLGHLRFKEDVSFLVATALAWLLVLPEYALNIFALRQGVEKYTGGQMAAFRLCSGVVCIALVSRFVLGEPLTTSKAIGFILMFASMILIVSPDRRKEGED